MTFEDSLVQTVGNNESKTFVDKMLAKEDTAAIAALVQKDKLTRTELLQALYYIASTEAKLVNYSDWDRYIILKYFIWIQEFIKIAELFYDFEDKMNKLDEEAKRPLAEGETREVNHFKLTDRAKQHFNNATLLMQHNAKFLIMLFLNIARTSLSVNAVGLKELITNKFEIAYPQVPTASGVQQERGFLSMGGKK